MARIQILSKKEKEELYSPPKFIMEERVIYFRLSQELENELFHFTDKNRLVFILLYGYFRVSHIFFNSSEFNLFDIQKVKEMYNLKFDDEPIHIHPKTEQRYKCIIRDYLGIQPYIKEDKTLFLNEALKLANNFLHRKKILYALIGFAKNLKIELPSYTEFSNIISIALTQQKNKMLEKLKVYKNDERLKLLDEFTEKDKAYKSRYTVMFFRRLEHSTTKRKMLDSLSKYQLIKSKFYQLEPIIKDIGITPKVAQYYATWVEKSKISQVTQKESLDIYFSLLCFVCHQLLLRTSVRQS